MDQPAGFTPSKCSRDPSRQRMISQRLKMLSTSLFVAHKSPIQKPETWANMQWSTTNRPATRELQLTTKANWYIQEKRRLNPAVLNEASIPRNNLSWIQEGKRTSIHKVVPVASSLPLVGRFSKKGGVGTPDYNISMAVGCSWMSI